MLFGCKRTRVRRFWQLLEMSIFEVRIEGEMSKFERHHQEKISLENQYWYMSNLTAIITKLKTFQKNTKSPDTQ